MSKFVDLAAFSCQIRAYRDAMAQAQDVDRYAVVIPFNNKEDCIDFCRRVNLTIAGIDDTVEAVAPLGTIGPETLEYAMDLASRMLSDEKALEDKKDE